jgi:peptide-methionine (R)-S-oxide reductase
VSLSRRALIGGAFALGGFALLGRSRAAAPARNKHFEVEKTDAQWKALLSPAAYDVLRHEGTEPAGTSRLLDEHREGAFLCAGCALPLFSSKTKFESHTGWPSFYAPLPNAVETTEDRTFMMIRTEVHCRRCAGHLGHVFDDGPKPTGLRYCMNGVALSFRPATS